ncbi:MAG: NAD(P)H-dependent oxidoreductase [Candidatus Pacearchaeota archaeon]
MINSEIINELNWRYATKKFDTTKHVTEDELHELLEVMRLSPSSFGLQPWKFIIVKNKDVRQKIRAAAWDQPQVTEASHLIVLCAKKDVTHQDIKKYIEKIASHRAISTESLKGFEDMMIGFRNARSNSEIADWAKRQVYIPLGMMLSACARKKIDACPMEGFNPNLVDEILGLESKGFTSVALCGIGHRAHDDHSANYAKVRFDTNEVIEFVN